MEQNHWNQKSSIQEFGIDKNIQQQIVQPQAQLIRRVSKRQGFGELALLYNAPRSATCMAIEECYLWGIDRHTFRKSFETIMRSEQDKNSKYLESVKFFNQLTREQKDAIAGVLISQKFKAGEIIVNEGDLASSFYIIVEGQCGVFNKEGQQNICTQFQ